MAIVYGINFGIGSTATLISIWRDIKGKDFDTDALRTLVSEIPEELQDNDPLFPQIAAREVCKKSTFIKFIYNDLVNTLAQRFNGYGQLKATYPEYADTLNYMGVVERMTVRHAKLAAERRNLTWEDMCEHRDGVGKTIWEQFGVADQSVVYAQ